MSKHAGTSRIADRALIDQVRACTEDICSVMWSQPPPIPRGELWRLLGRALALLEQIGEMGQ